MLDPIKDTRPSTEIFFVVLRSGLRLVYFEGDRLLDTTVLRKN